MPRWPSQPPVEPVAKRARKNAVKETANVDDPHSSVVEALSAAEAVPLGVREMLRAGLDGCLACSSAKGGKAVPRHPFQDKILGAVVDALETAETTIKNEVAEAEVALEASQAEMASCEGARQTLELGLAESTRNIEGQEKALEENADALENTRHALGAAEAALRRTDTEIGEAAMRRLQISQVLRLATSMSEKGAPDGECAKFLEENRHLIEPCAERAAEHATSALQDPFVEESVHEDATANQILSEPDAEQMQDSVAAEVQQELSGRLAEQLSRFSKCTTELESIVSQSAAARISRVAEVGDAQAECSAMLAKRSEQTTEFREAKKIHRQSEASLKANEKEMKRIQAKCEACAESLESAQESLTELQQGPLSKCRRVATNSVKVLAIDSVDVVPKQDLKCMHVEGDVEMRIELVGAGC